MRGPRALVGGCLVTTLKPSPHRRRNVPEGRHALQRGHGERESDDATLLMREKARGDGLVTWVVAGEGTRANGSPGERGARARGMRGAGVAGPSQ